MKYKDAINSCYTEAVQGLNESILGDKDAWFRHITNLPTHLQVVYTVVVFHKQVINGGLHQFFFNSNGQFAYITVNHLKLIGAFKSAQILEDALGLVNTGQLSTEEFREKVFYRALAGIVDFDEDLFDALEKLDDAYDELDEDLEHLLTSYLDS
ncbi:DMP19 family protein [Pedobacter faecalis]|uniref:DMP19 family protein n=1 Tax=Pedobacter faecalis TaxID=3041495 RepID=UPI00254A023D|nr:DUF4375 domain-containing protein [Pedobacter sp. ELA7]